MKKGDIIRDGINSTGLHRELTTCIGFIIALKHGIGFNQTEITLDNNCEWTTPYTQAKCYDTIEKAELKAKAIQKKYTELLYCRPYFCTKFTPVKQTT